MTGSRCSLHCLGDLAGTSVDLVYSLVLLVAYRNRRDSSATCNTRHGYSNVASHGVRIAIVKCVLAVGRISCAQERGLAKNNGL